MAYKALYAMLGFSLMAFLFTLGSCLQDEGKRGLQILSYSIRKDIVHGSTFVILF